MEEEKVWLFCFSCKASREASTQKEKKVARSGAEWKCDECEGQARPVWIACDQCGRWVPPAKHLLPPAEARALPSYVCRRCSEAALRAVKNTSKGARVPTKKRKRADNNNNNNNND